MNTQLQNKNTFVYSVFISLFGLVSFVSFQSMSFGNQTVQIQPNWKDLSYAKIGDKEKLDIYLPAEGKGPYPVIIYIHNGAWSAGSKTPGSALEGIKKGYAVIALGYSLSQNAKFPRQIYEIKAAIRWLRANSKDYKLNSDKIAVWGDSAGGHLAALAGTTGDVNSLEDPGMGNPKQSCRVQAVVDWYGPIDLLNLVRQQKEAGIMNSMFSDSDFSDLTQFLGAPMSKIPELAKQATPSSFISKDDPPFFIQHGKTDAIVPYQQSVDFATKLEKVLGSDKVTLDLLDDAGHGGTAFSNQQNLEKVFKFLDKYLKDNDPNKIVAKHIIFSGRVQGVGFRNRALTISGSYPITGFVQNLADGTVEMLAQGKTQDIENYVRDIKGAFANNIKEIKIDETNFDPKYKDFQITYLP
jgi:acetyl esterase/lipase/acylphosphatase